MAEVEHLADPSSRSPNNNFIFTCFGAFLNVTDNPSRKVAKLVQSTLTTTTKSNNTMAVDIPVHELEVSKDYVIKFFDDMYHQLEAELQTANSTTKQQQQPNATTASLSPPVPPIVFLIHFGVHRSASHIHIERRGLNCAHYHPGPDVNGFLCQNQPILTPPPSSGANATIATQPVEFFPPTTNSKLWSVVGSTLTQNISPISVLRGVNSPVSNDDGDNLRLIRGYIETPISLKWIEDACGDVNRTVYGPTNNEASTTASNDEKQLVELKPSHDAGQYLCNTALFCSLAVTATLQQQAGTAATVESSDSPTPTSYTTAPPRYVSLFVHVVNEEVLSVEKQATLISAFLRKLKKSTDFQ